MSQSNETKRDELAAQIAQMETDLTEHEADIKAAKEIISESEDRIHEITGGPFGGRYGGLLNKAKREHGKLCRMIADKDARTVVWAGTRYGIGRDDRWVVIKITPKRIYARAEGSEDSTYFDYSGTQSYGASIDIAKTFPEGLEAFKAGEA